MTLQKFLASRTGKRFYNFCYCWGACLIILGAVSKIALLPYSNIYLMIGLATEVFIFFISGFEEPAREYKWERVFPILNDKEANINPKLAATNFNAIDANQIAKEEMAKMEANLKKLNEVYEKQIAAMKEMQQTDLSDHTKQMAANIKLLNKQYKSMLDAFNVNTEK